MFALILLFIFLVLLLLKRRAARRESRLRAEIDPTPTPLGVVDTREGLNRQVSVNDDGPRSEIPRPIGALCVLYSCHLHDSSFSLVRSSSQTIPPANVDLKRARTNYTVHSSIHDDSRVHLTSEYTSNANLHVGGHFQSNSSQDLITNGTITEEMTDTPTYMPSQSAHLQTDSTGPRISTSSDAPPAYDSLPSRI